jgi:valyl-tRNA synthetase
MVPDGVRMGMLLCSPAGNDILFDEKLVEQGRNFSNKLWNALRLVKGWEVTDGELAENKIAIDWIEARLNQTVEELEKSFTDFRLSEALMTIYKFIWDDFCSWYLEMIKPEYQKPIDRYTYEKTISIFEQIVKVLHPFMPFITEEIYHTLRERKEGETICLAAYPAPVSVNQGLIHQASLAFEIITNIRELRAKANKKNTETVDVFYNGTDEVSFENFRTQIIKLARVGELSAVADDKQGLKTFLAKGYKFFVLTGKEGDGAAEEREKLLKELEYTRGFLASVEKKLSNEKFMASAKPQVIESETKKKEDALKKIAVLEQSLGLSA